ncbi:exonuclease V [Lipomyces japonicus]|uniref:exonuclease V n=1 Tax=Lipomyces japonicus TaxID=56871 RepID=UPI0034CF12C1
MSLQIQPRLICRHHLARQMRPTKLIIVPTLRRSICFATGWRSGQARRTALTPGLRTILTQLRSASKVHTVGGDGTPDDVIIGHGHADGLKYKTSPLGPIESLNHGSDIAETDQRDAEGHYERLRLKSQEKDVHQEEEQDTENVSKLSHNFEVQIEVTSHAVNRKRSRTTSSSKSEVIPYLKSNGIPSKPLEEEEKKNMLPLLFSDAPLLKDSMLKTYKKGWRLNVTDLVGPSYCELQYFYKYYKKDFTPTAVMVKGTKIHKKLEKDYMVPMMVPEEGMTKEDVKASELVSMLVSLQSLTQAASLGPNEEAIVREFKVFGYIDNIYISGIIDDLSFMPHRPKPDNVGYLDYEDQSPVSSVAPRRLKTYQRYLTSYFQKPKNLEGLNESFRSDVVPRERVFGDRQIRIADSKTRRDKSIPGESQRKSTYYQLMMYYRLFKNLVHGEFDFDRWSAHMRINPDAKLSNVFQTEFLKQDSVTQIFDMELQATEWNDNTEYFELLFNIKTLRDLWNVLKFKFAEFRGQISDQLTVVYIWQGDSEIFGGIDYSYKKEDVDQFLQDVLSYWRAERNPKGVEVEEAFKCRTCVFADQCLWRNEKIRESTLRYREKFRKTYKYDKPPGQLVVEKSVN